MERVRRSWGMVEGNDVSSVGSRSELSLGLKQEVKAEVQSYSVSHIDVLVTREEEDASWCFTFYENPIESEKHL